MTTQDNIPAKKHGRISGEVHTDRMSIKVQLPIVSFEENGCKIIYCPALDLSGYGMTEDEAKASFHTSLEEFFRYTINKKTLDKVLTKLDQTRNIPDPYPPPSLNSLSGIISETWVPRRRNS